MDSWSDLDRANRDSFSYSIESTCLLKSAEFSGITFSATSPLSAPNDLPLGSDFFTRDIPETRVINATMGHHHNRDFYSTFFFFLNTDAYAVFYFNYNNCLHNGSTNAIAQVQLFKLYTAGHRTKVKTLKSQRAWNRIPKCLILTKLLKKRKYEK